jgi:hypothetical protein
MRREFSLNDLPADGATYETNIKEPAVYRISTALIVYVSSSTGTRSADHFITINADLGPVRVVPPVN